MNDQHVRGVAMILEGYTERVFYRHLIKFYIEHHQGIMLSESFDAEFNVETWILSGKQGKTIIRFHVIGTISQMPRVHLWFRAACMKAVPDIPWTVALCYDTDDCDARISPFRQGDWPQLSDHLLESKASVVDLAARADIEDIMLQDFPSVAAFLGASIEDGIPAAQKGKRKMRLLFARYGKTYHEGERAEPMISALNFEVIIASGILPFEEFEKAVFWFDNQGG